jgi:hypothetical protein
MPIRVYDKENDATIEVSPAEAREGFAAGRFEIRDKVQVRKGLQTGDVDPHNIAKALAGGWDLADAEEVRQLKIRREEDGAVGATIGMMESMASGATLGLSDLVETEVLGVDPERMAARAQASEGAAEAAYLAGALAPALLTGGASTGATGAGLAARGAGSLAGRGLGLAARGLSAPVRALEGAGALAERGIVGALGEGALARGIGTGVRGAVEGAGYEIGTQIHENVLGNREWNAELLSAGINGGLLGGGIGVAIPGIARMVSGKTRLPESAAAEVLAKQVDGQPSDLLKSAAKFWAGGSASRAEGIEKVGRYLTGTKDEADLLWRSQFDQEALMRERADEIVSATQRLNDNVVGSVIESEGVFRRAAVARKMPKGADDVVPQRIRDRIATLTPDIERQHMLAREFKLNELAAEYSDVREALRKLTYDTEQIKKISAVDAHRNLQEVWRDMGVQVRALEKAAYGPAANRNAMRALEHISPVHRELNGLLSDATVFGDDLALMHSELAKTNAAALLARKEAGKGSVGRLLDPRVPTTPEDAMRFAKQASKYGGDASVEKVGAYFDAEIAAMEAKARHFDDPVFKQRHAELVSARKEWGETMAKNAEVADLIEAHKAMGGGSATTGILTALGPSGAAVTGGLVGGLPGAMLGAAANVLARPQQALRTLSGIRRLLDRVDGSIAESIGKVVSSMRGKGAAGPAKASSKAARAFGLERTLTKAGIVGGTYAMGRKQRQERAQTFQDRAQMFASSPDALIKELSPLLYDVDSAAPGLAGVLQSNVQRAAIFLASKQPISYADPFSGQKPIVDQASLAKYERYVEAVADPIGVLEQLHNGTVSVEHAEALREVYPQIYQRAQGQILSELGAAAEEGRAIPYRTRVQLGIAFQIPTDYSLRPDVLARLAMGTQEAAKETAEESRPIAAASKIESSDRKMTTIDRLTEGAA